MANLRLYSDAYDSVRQSSNMKWDNDEEARCYLARLRLDAFFSGTVVVTDAQLLDGVFFLDAGQRGFASDLPLSRMEVRCRASSLSESLLRTFVQPGRQNLAGFWFSSLPAEARAHVQTALAQHKASNVNTWRDILSALKAIGLEGSVAERIETAWAHWIEKADRGEVKIQQWNPQFPWDSTVEAHLQKSKFALEKNIVTVAGREATTLAWKNRAYRSTTTAELTRLEAPHAPESDEAQDIASVIAWYNRAYHLTAAKQHNCNSVDSTAPPSSRPFSVLLRTFDRALNLIEERKHPDKTARILNIELPRGFAAGLASMPVDELERTIEAHKGNLAAWHARRDLKRLKLAIEGLAQAAKTGGFDGDNAIPNSVFGTGRLLALAGAAAALSLFIVEPLHALDVGISTFGGLDALKKVGESVSPRRRAERQIVEFAKSRSILGDA